MNSVTSALMAGKKGKFLHIRSDEELHAALKAAAERSCRKDTDQARYLLRLATWHTLRHSFADRLSQLAPILDVQEAGRWGSWQSMRRYLKRNNARTSSAVQQLKSPIPLAHLLPLDKETAFETNAQAIEI